MLGLDSLNFYRSMKRFHLFFLTDYVDKLNHLTTPTILLCITAMIVALNQKDLNCFSTENPGFHPYLNSYCFFKGTIALLPYEDLPQTRSAWLKAESLYLTSRPLIIL